MRRLFIMALAAAVAVLAGCGGGSGGGQPIGNVPAKGGLRDQVAAAADPVKTDFPATQGRTLQAVADSVTPAGTAWFDSLSLSVDGKPLTPWTLGTKGQAWLRRAAIPLTSVDANAPTSDLAPLGRLLGSARVVALGEGTHGTASGPDGAHH